MQALGDWQRVTHSTSNTVQDELQSCVDHAHQQTTQQRSFFLPRDAMRKRGIAIGRCLSDRLSVTLVYCIKTSKSIVKLLFLGPFSRAQAPLHNSKGNSLSEGLKYTGGGKNFQF